jgi:DNA-binding LytR/AlgR family response regulator
MALKIAVCDDVTNDSQLLVSFIKEEVPYCEVLVYKSGEALLWDLESSSHIDIFFLDIFMEGMNGIETASRIRNLDPDALLVFVSSSKDFYRESYDLYAFNYLIKPVTKDKLAEVLHHALEQISKEVDNVISISFRNRLHRIRCSQLMYISSEGHIVNFYMKSGDILKAYGKLDDYAAQLPSEIFLRCHQSYIINLNFVTALTANEFAIGEIGVPISRSYSAFVKDKYCSHMFGDF